MQYKVSQAAQASHCTAHIQTVRHYNKKLMTKIITKNQLTGDISEYFVAYFLSSKLNIIYRPISKRDTGVDAEIELTEKFDDNRFIATGIFIKVQVKSSVEKEFKKGVLSIFLNDDDINYFTTDMNLPGVLIFVDLKDSEPKAYWTEIIPKIIKGNNTVTIKEKNIVDAETIKDFKKIENYYRSIKLRDELVYYFDTTAELAISHIEKASSVDGLGYILSNYYEDIINIRNIYELSFVKDVKKEVVPEYVDVLGSALNFTKRIDKFIEQANNILKEKGFKEIGNYIDLSRI